MIIFILPYSFLFSTYILPSPSHTRSPMIFILTRFGCPFSRNEVIFHVCKSAELSGRAHSCTLPPSLSDLCSSPLFNFPSPSRSHPSELHSHFCLFVQCGRLISNTVAHPSGAQWYLVSLRCGRYKA